MTDTIPALVEANEIAARDATKQKFAFRLASEEQRSGYEVGYYDALAAMPNASRVVDKDEAAREISNLTTRILELAPLAGLYVGINITDAARGETP